MIFHLYFRARLFSFLQTKHDSVEGSLRCSHDLSLGSGCDCDCDFDPKADRM